MAKILIIDNDSSSRNHLARHLTDSGYEVDVVTTQEDAILQLTDAYHRGTPYGAVCLASMVGCTEVGYKLAMRIRAMRGYRSTPILGGSFDKVFWDKVAHLSRFTHVEISFVENTPDSVWNIRQVIENLPFTLTRAA